MPSGALAALVAAFAFLFVESLGRWYPSHATWWKLRRARGRDAVRAMRERFEAAAGRRSPRVLAVVLLVMVVAWVASSSLLDKRWYEVALDVVPYVIVVGALLRMPSVLRSIGARMKDYERQVGDDPDSARKRDEDGSGAVAL